MSTVNKIPEKRIKWHHVDDCREANEERHYMARWEDGYFSERKMIDYLRKEYGLSKEEWPTEVILQNVHWVGYGNTPYQS